MLPHWGACHSRLTRTTVYAYVIYYVQVSALLMFYNTIPFLYISVKGTVTATTYRIPSNHCYPHPGR